MVSFNHCNYSLYTQDRLYVHNYSFAPLVPLVPFAPLHYGTTLELEPSRGAGQ